MIILSVCSFSTMAQTSSHRLDVADSLFRAKRYVESYEQYQNILESKQYSTAMLLKMAYIQEGLNHIGQAMYYLNLYFLASNDKSVLSKMETMATKFNLEGYETSDKDQFLSFYHDYNFYISIFLAALLCLFISIIFYTRFKRKKRPIVSVVFMVIVIIGFFVHLNFGDRITTGVIAESDTFIMEGPSAGAPVTKVVNEGHRVEVLGEKDVWLKVKWNDEIAYVKSNRILPIEF